MNEMGTSDREAPPPDPDMRVAILGSFSPQEAALLAGRLEAEGVRAMVTTGQGAPGPWTAIGGTFGFPLAANPLQQRTADVLVDERDLARARKIARPLRRDVTPARRPRSTSVRGGPGPR